MKSFFINVKNLWLSAFLFSIFLLIDSHNLLILKHKTRNELKHRLTPKAHDLSNHFGTNHQLGLYGPDSNLGSNFNRLGLASDSKNMRTINPTIQIAEIKSGKFTNLSSDSREFINPATAGKHINNL